MSAALIVTCARCLADYREDDPAVRYEAGDWFCQDEAACDDRMAATCRCGHPHLPGTVMCYACDLPLAPLQGVLDGQ